MPLGERGEKGWQRQLKLVLWSIAVRGLSAALYSSGISAQRHVGKLPLGDFFLEPELAPSGPLVMIISLPDQTLSAYRNGIRIGEFEWNPERSGQGPITILASSADQTIYVYRNGIPIGRAAFTIDDPKRPLDGHAFTMLERVLETQSTFVPGRPAHHWMAVRMEGNTTLEDLGRRVRVSPAFAEKVYDIVSPGTTVVVTDAPALRPSPSARAVFLMEAAKR